jgi:glutaredoxin-like protein NrdH
MPKVTVYTLPVCVQCDRTKKLLDREGIEYDTVDLAADPVAAAKFKEEGFLQAPIVVVGNDGRRWGGFRPDLITELKHSDKEA